MSVIDLTILGILKYKSSNPYEIVRIVDEYKINKWMKITAPSIYQNLKKMHSRGYLSCVTEKDGEMPEKTIYSITGHGEEYFLRLMEKNSENPLKVYENFLPFISNLVHIDRETGLEMLKKLRQRFLAEKEDVDNYLNKLPEDAVLYDKALLQYHSKILNAKLEWWDDLFIEYREKGYGYPR